MKLCFPQLERNIRHAARREIRQSHELWPQYQQRIWQNRVTAALHFGAACLLVFGTPVLPLVFSMPLIGLGEKERAHLGKPNDPEIILGLFSLAAVGILLVVLGAHNRAYVHGHSHGLFEPLEVRMLAHLPLPDRLFGALDWPLVISIGTVVLLFFGAPYGFLAWHLGLGWSGWLAAMGLLLLHLVVLFATALFAIAFSPTNRLIRKCLIVVGGLLCVACLFMGLRGLWLPKPIAVSVEACLYIVPTGWVSGAFLNGLVKGVPTAWLWLLPAVAVIGCATPLLLDWLRSELLLREFVIAPRGWSGVIERGFRVPKDLPEPPPLFGQKSQPPRDRATSPGMAGADDRIRICQCLRDPTWRASQRIERICDRWLTRRQRAILRVWSGSYERLTAQWFALALALIVCWALAFLIRDAPAKERDIPLWGMPLTALAVSRFCVRGGTPDLAYARLIRWYPATFAETTYAAWKQDLVRAANALPLVLGYGMAVAALVGIPFWEGGIYSVVTIIIMLCFEPVLAMEKLYGATDDATQLLTKAVSYAVIFAAVCAVAVAFRFPVLHWRIASIALLFLASGFTWWWCNRVYCSGKFDLVSGPSRRHGQSS